MGYKALLEELQQENLCTWFILPLLHLNKVSFISSNFVNSYLSRDRQYLIVEVIDEGLLSRKVFFANPWYIGKVDYENRVYLVYSINHLKEVTDLFCEGRFSEFPDNVKETIRVMSGLQYEVSIKGKLVTDGRLLGLEKHKALKKMWNELIEPIEEIEGELLSIPGEASFIDIDVLPGKVKR